MNQEKEECNRLEEDLDNSYKDYMEKLKTIYPGSKDLKDNYTKIISLIQNKNPFLKSPAEQKEKIENILHNFFESSDVCEKMLYLYADILQYNQMKDLEFKNSPEEVSQELEKFFTQKFFRLKNLKEKIISRSNHIINVNNIKKFSLILSSETLMKNSSLTKITC
jgi:hypothetical protein